MLLKWRLVKQSVAWIELHLEYVLSETRTKDKLCSFLLKKEVNIFAEYTGLYGFIAKSGYQAVFPGVNQGKQVFYQGSRQMDNFSRRYYERELGAGIAPSPSMREHFGYTEPFRRFVQREDFSPQANEIPNTRSPRPFSLFAAFGLRYEFRSPVAHELFLYLLLALCPFLARLLSLPGTRHRPVPRSRNCAT